jgi:hypothetical protein
MKLAEKLEDQKKQNRAYVEVRPLPSFLPPPVLVPCHLHRLIPLRRTFASDREREPNVQQFKAQERESQRYRSKKKERAFLKAIPIIPVSSTRLSIPIKLINSQLPLYSSLLLPNLALEV